MVSLPPPISFSGRASCKMFTIKFDRNARLVLKVKKIRVWDLLESISHQIKVIYDTTYKNLWMRVKGLSVCRDFV